MTTRTLMRTMLLTSAAAMTLGTGFAGAQVLEDASRYPQVVIYTPGYAVVAAPPVVAVQQPVVAVQQPAVPILTDAQLDQLLGPIALYPDPLLAQLLPATVYPAEVAVAARWLQTIPPPDENTINAQLWEPSIKALLRYPSVLQMLNDHLDWTQAVGAAFVNQTQDVSESIQRLRLQAQAAGALASTPQQTVIVDQGVVQILPASPQVIYVPVYDSQVVYVRRATRPVITFSVGFRVGGWLDNDIDWRRHTVAVGAGWHPGWQFDARQGWVRDARVVVDVREGRRGWEADHAVAPPRAWTPNPAKPRPVLPPALSRPVRDDEHRGWAAPTPAPTPRPAPFVLPERHDEVRHEEPHQAVPAPPRPTVDVFGGYQNRSEVERAQDRARQVLPSSAAPALRATPAPIGPQLQPHGTLVTSTPHATSTSGQLITPSTFQPGGSTADVHADSQRGHDSMHH